MDFFDRQNEIQRLRDIRALSERHAQFTVITGRRRIGKTSLLLRAFGDQPFLYFFVSRKAEPELCRDFADETRDKLQLDVFGAPSRFIDLFELIVNHSKRHPVTLVIDEFQDFARVNNAVFSDMQRVWDLNKQEAKLNLVVCGSVNSMMNKLFRDNKEPLFGRHTALLSVRPFTPSVLTGILLSNNADATPDDLLALYLFSGGVAKYVETLIDNGAVTRDRMLEYVTDANSPFVDEGKLLLVDEFGRDYGIYFSIMSLISQGYNTRAQMEDMLHREIGGYLTALEREYGLLSKHQPLFESSNRGMRYAIEDNVLRFWFRFFYKYSHMIEVRSFDKVRDIVYRDYDTYSGLVLEQLFREKLIESGRYTQIGYWHDRHGMNEIDIIGIDELSSAIDFYEVKRSSRAISLGTLRDKASVFLHRHPQFSASRARYIGLSLDDLLN